MTTKSHTTNIGRREVIGDELFSQRRDVFGKHDTVFLPPSSPTSLAPAMEVETVITSNHAKTTNNFRRTPAYSSMRETKRSDPLLENGFRTRKYSDNFASESHQNDDVDYRHSMAERTRRLSKLRRDFLASNLHESVSPDPFARVGTRASMPVGNGSIKYKIESPKLFKFPFAEPFATPPPVRKVIVDLGPIDTDVEQVTDKENEDPEVRKKHQSLTNGENDQIIDHHKLFDELVKRYSPQRKPIDWTLPPTKPRVVGSVPKSSNNSLDSLDGKKSIEKIETEGVTPTNEVFIEPSVINKANEENNIEDNAQSNQEATISDKEETEITNKRNSDSKDSPAELDENKDKIADLSTVHRESPKKSTVDNKPDISIPELLEKINHEADDNESISKTRNKKVKRKRSFLDKILGRNKDKTKN